MEWVLQCDYREKQEASYIVRANALCSPVTSFLYFSPKGENQNEVTGRFLGGVGIMQIP